MLESTLVVGPFQCNCRLLVCEKTGQGVLIDPGDDAPLLLEAIQKQQTPTGAPVQIQYLLQTHGHLDHIAASRGVKEALSQGLESPRIALHRGDEEMYRALKLQGRMFGLDFSDPLPIDHYLNDEEQLQVGSLKFSILHTPGHSPGSVCIRLHEDSAAGVGEILFSGDTLFQGSVGRTDLWGADADQMFRSIRSRILTLDEEIRVCPGHGPDTQVGIEKRKNPFLQY